MPYHLEFLSYFHMFKCFILMFSSSISPHNNDIWPNKIEHSQHCSGMLIIRFLIIFHMIIGHWHIQKIEQQLILLYANIIMNGFFFKLRHAVWSTSSAKCKCIRALQSRIYSLQIVFKGSKCAVYIHLASNNQHILKFRKKNK